MKLRKTMVLATSFCGWQVSQNVSVKLYSFFAAVGLRSYRKLTINARVKVAPSTDKAVTYISTQELFVSIVLF